MFIYACRHLPRKFEISVTSFNQIIFYSYMKDGLQASNKMNSLARSNASLYGNKDDLYDRLRRHAYQGKKSGKTLDSSNFDDSFKM